MGAIVCFGEILIDLLAQPPASADTPRAFLQYAGGAPANVAVAAARLGAKTQFVGMLGRDMFGDFLADSLVEHGRKLFKRNQQIFFFFFQMFLHG